MYKSPLSSFLYRTGSTALQAPQLFVFSLNSKRKQQKRTFKKHIK